MGTQRGGSGVGLSVGGDATSPRRFISVGSAIDETGAIRPYRWTFAFDGRALSFDWTWLDEPDATHRFKASLANAPLLASILLTIARTHSPRAR